MGGIPVKVRLLIGSSTCLGRAERLGRRLDCLEGAARLVRRHALERIQGLEAARDRAAGAAGGRRVEEVSMVRGQAPAEDSEFSGF